ncbi:MAG: maleylpyruvate isomerase family mycothiol-dependent enzyme [Acidimicrobiia bacterium]|nr:maleylpyruvate isomerase family mycothiol-dependent enzyme [Acidimicrobiia bacterium]
MTPPRPLIDPLKLYKPAVERIAHLVTHPAAGSAPVAACPGWTVKDTIAHLVGIAQSWITGTLDGYADPAWTAAQVASMEDATVEELVAVWYSVLDDFLERMQSIDELPEAVLTPFGMLVREAVPLSVLDDLVSHEHDIRQALGRPGARDDIAVRLATGSHVGLMRRLNAAAGLPTIEIITTDDRAWLVGTESPSITLRAPLFEVFRATGGRRTTDEIWALDWSDDPEPFLPTFVMPMFSPPSVSLEE